MNAERLLSEFRAAEMNLRKALPTNKGGQAAEKRYSAAYTALVKAGLAPALRKKYR